MGRTGDEAAAAADARPATCAQVHPRAERRRQPGIAGHHQGEATRPADPRQILSERRAARFAVMAQHHAGKSARQARRRRARIGQPARIGEQPERRKVGGAAPRAARAPRRAGAYPSCAFMSGMTGANGSPIMSKRKHAIEAYFQSGVRLHGAGRLQEAEQVYRQVLAAAPGMPTACTCWA